MKAWGSGGALKTHYAQSTTTIAGFWRVIRTDLSVFGWVELDVPITIDSVVYRASEGLSMTTAHSTQDISVDTIDVTAFLDVSTEAEIAAGVWDKSIVTHFETNYMSPPVSVSATTCNIIRHGRLGQIKRQLGLFTAEGRGLSQQLSTRIGTVYAPTCRWRHAQWDIATQEYISSPQCGIDANSFAVTGTVTSVGSDARLIIGASGVSSDAGYFNDGILTMTSGANQDISREIRRWDNKEFALHRRFFFPVVNGDTFAAMAGDDKTKATCRDKFANVINFFGFDPPGINKVFSVPVRF